MDIDHDIIEQARRNAEKMLQDASEEYSRLEREDGWQIGPDGRVTLADTNADTPPSPPAANGSGTGSAIMPDSQSQSSGTGTSTGTGTVGGEDAVVGGEDAVVVSSIDDTLTEGEEGGDGGGGGGEGGGGGVPSSVEAEEARRNVAKHEMLNDASSKLSEYQRKKNERALKLALYEEKARAYEEYLKQQEAEAKGQAQAQAKGQAQPQTIMPAEAEAEDEGEAEAEAEGEGEGEGGAGGAGGGGGNSSIPAASDAWGMD